MEDEVIASTPAQMYQGMAAARLYLSAGDGRGRGEDGRVIGGCGHASSNSEVQQGHDTTPHSRRSPGSPVQLVTSAHSMRPSLMKAAHADISSAAYGRSGSLGVLTQCFLIDIVRSVKVLSLVARICLGLAASGLAAAQFQALAQSSGAPEWPTGSFDQQRDGWQRNETKITVDNAKNIRLLWKLKTDNKSMGMQSFREPLIVAGVNTAGGVKTLAILAGSSDDVYVVDAASGALVWQKHLKWSSDKPEEPGQGAGFICNNALTATPVVTPAGAAQRFVYVLTNDGYLHTLDLATGDEPDAPIKMLPAPYGKAYGLNLVNNVVYTVTGQACHGVAQ